MANYAPFGLLTPAAWVALHAQRYMSTYGVTNEDFGRISVVDRAHAARNPDAWFYERPITLEDHQDSRWVVEPVLRLLDCCQESDGGVALVVTSAERARDLRQPPAVITAAVQGAAAEGEMMTSYYRDDITGLPEMGVVAEKLWRDSGLKPADIQTAFLYDHFTPFVFAQLEELGFCGRGEAKDFATVERLSLGGELPINTNGGLLGEAYIHGMNGITEGVRQVRGTSCNQVDDVEHVLVTSGTGVPTSALILAPRTDDAAMTTAIDRDRHPRAHHRVRLRLLPAGTVWTRRPSSTSPRAADVSRSTVYEYFRDKAEIVEACAEHSSQKFYREMAKAMGKGETLEDKLTLAAVFVTRARRFFEPEKYFDADEVSLLLTKNAAVLLRECTEFLAPYLTAAKLTGEVRKDLDVAAAGEWYRADAVLVVQHTVGDVGHGRRRASSPNSCEPMPYEDSRGDRAGRTPGTRYTK